MSQTDDHRVAENVAEALVRSWLFIIIWCILFSGIAAIFKSTNFYAYAASTFIIILFAEILSAFGRKEE